MSRLGAVLLLAGVFLSFAVPARAEDEEPSFLDKKLSYWLNLLAEGKDAKARQKGILGLEQIGHDRSKKVVPALVKAVREDREPVVRARAARAVGRAAARALDQAREDKKDELPRFDTVRDALAVALRTDKAETVREAAALALGDLGGEGRGAVGALAKALEDKHTGTVKAAAATLKRLGRDAQGAQTELQQLLLVAAADPEARVDAAVCLGQMRPEPAPAVTALKQVVADEKSDARIRRASAEALGKLGKDAAEATPALAGLLTSRDSTPELRLAAVTALDQFGPDGKAAIPALVKAVGDTELIKAMGENARFVRCLAMHALSRMGKELDRDRKAAVKALLEAAEDANVEVCVSAIETLGTLTAEGQSGETEEITKKLETILLREGRKAVREAAQAARDKIKPKK